MNAVMIKAAKASGADDRTALDCTGVCLSHGAKESYRFAFDGTSFYQGATGTLTDISAFDGKNFWAENWAGVPHYVGLVSRDTNELLSWVESGEWALKECPLQRKLPDIQHEGQVLVSLQPDDGNTVAELTLDAETMLPKKLKYWTESGDETWTFSDYKKYGDRSLPCRANHQMSETTDWYEIDDATPKHADPALYALPKPDLSDTTYDASSGSDIEIKRIFGYMFVHPLVNGKDVGWFFLDSGADVMCLDPKVAAENGFVKLGSDTTAGVVAVVKLAIVRGQSFQLGPVTIKNPTFYGFDMAPFQAFGIKIAGICGYDFVARSVMSIDPATSKISIFRPGSAEVPEGIQWSPVKFNGNTPCLICGFEGGRTGVFSLDTGSSSTVDLFSPVVAKLGLLKGRTTGTARTAGAGGGTESKTGTIDYFDIGGHRFDKPEVGLQTTKAGVFASPNLEGNVGMGFLGHFHLIFDYPGSRIGFLWRK
jgi:hypothetical protein